MARTITLIAPVRRGLPQVSCSSETVPNAPKRKETHQNMSLGSDGVDRERRCKKFRHNFVARTFALIAPFQLILHRVSCNNKMVPNAPKHYKTDQNMSLGSDGVDREDLLQKILTQFCGLNFCINFNSSARF